MRTKSPEILPLFRSAGQARLLTRIYLEEDRPAPLADLAREVGIDKAGATREANRLERAGLVVSDRVGRQRLLRPNRDSVHYRDLYGLLLRAFGPPRLVGQALSRIDGVAAAYLYGSWAERYHDVPGAEPADVDVMVVGVPDRRAIARAGRELTATLGREVNATIVTEKRWREGSDGFIRQVKDGPLVALALQSLPGA